MLRRTAPILLIGLVASAVFAQRHDVRVVIESDGWKLVGDLRVPATKKPVPIVVMLNKANGTRRAYDALAGQLSDRGIASLRIDLRGHGESINKGKFGPPFDAPMQALVDGSDKDVSAAVLYLTSVKGIDATRVGVVGASYTGEEMAVSARTMGFAKAYVALSPGSFSEESIKGIDASGAAWLFIRSADERFLGGMHENIRKASRTARLLEVPGNKHASDILGSDPWLTDMIATWFKYNL